MKVLTDTHSFLWYAWDDTRLSQSMATLLDDENNTVYVSIVSLWEITIKDTIGKLALGMPLSDFFDRFVVGNGFEVLPLTQEHLLIARTLPLHHRDPFDRMLIAQSKAEGIPFVSNDSIMDVYSVNRLW